MGRARHIGRIAALAVTLGVGTTVAGAPAIGFAAPDTDSVTGDSAARAESDAAGPTSPDVSVHSQESTTAARTDADGSPSLPTQHITSVPDGLEGANTSTTTDIGPELDQAADDLDSLDSVTTGSQDPDTAERAVPLVSTRPAIPEIITDPVMAPTYVPQKGSNTTLADAALHSHATTPEPTTAEMSAERTEPPASPLTTPLAVIQGAGYTPAAPDDSSVGLAKAPDATTWVEALTQAPRDLIDSAVTITSGVLTSALAPFVALLPQDPTVPSPALWTMLAAARREIGAVEIVEDRPSPAPNAATSQATSPADVSSMLSPLGDLVAKIAMFVERQFKIYDFSDARGWAAFVLDYTWGLPGTMTGMVVQVINTFFWPTDPGYREDLSYHQNLHVYEGGITFSAYGSCQTWGNVITNAGANRGGGNPRGIDPVVQMHESVHIWQSRLAGPLFQITYGGHLIVGALVATMIWLSDPSQDLYELVYQIAYYNIPWEAWAREIAP